MRFLSFLGITHNPEELQKQIERTDAHLRKEQKKMTTVNRLSSPDDLQHAVHAGDRRRVQSKIDDLSKQRAKLQKKYARRTRRVRT